MLKKPYIVKNFPTLLKARKYSNKFLSDYGYTPEIYKTRNKDKKTYKYQIVKPINLKRLK